MSAIGKKGAANSKGCDKRFAANVRWGKVARKEAP